MQTKVRFHHIRDLDHTLTGTIAYIIEGTVIRYAVVYCDPRDNFSRKIGRILATDRLLKEECRFVSVCTNKHNPLTGIFASIYALGQYPHRATYLIEVRLYNLLASEG